MRKYQPPKDHFFRLPNSVFALPLDAAQFKLYAYLVCRSGSKGYCWPALKAIIRDTGIKKSSLQKAFKVLKARRLIAVQKESILFVFGHEKSPFLNNGRGRQHFMLSPS